jgi:hypothetical protein
MAISCDIFLFDDLLGIWPVLSLHNTDTGKIQCSAVRDGSRTIQAAIFVFFVRSNAIERDG